MWNKELAGLSQWSSRYAPFARLNRQLDLASEDFLSKKKLLAEQYFVCPECILTAASSAFFGGHAAIAVTGWLVGELAGLSEYEVHTAQGFSNRKGDLWHSLPSRVKSMFRVAASPQRRHPTHPGVRWSRGPSTPRADSLRASACSAQDDSVEDL